MPLVIPELEVLLRITVEAHDDVLLEEQKEGLALDKSLESALQRTINRYMFGMIDDVFHLAACFCVAIAVGHTFNDANKRTAVTIMDMILLINGVDIDYDQIELADHIVEVAKNKMTDYELADWLRSKA